MRLIGNKTRLLGDIEKFLRDRGIRGGTLIDIFSGTASVGRHFKSLGYRVLANDRLSMCYAKAVAGVEVSRYPAFEGLRQAHGDVLRSKSFLRSFAYQPDVVSHGTSLSASLPLAEAVHFLGNFVAPREGMISRCFCPAGGKGRMYFTDENGKRMDGMLSFLREGRRSGLLSREELYLLLSSLLDAADRVANISGTYGAYLKKWQRNALQPLTLKVPEVIESSLEHRAHRRDANELIRELRGNVLYIDPPYNRRQYAANYHVLEIIAEHNEVDDLVAHEAALYGKTGLRPYGELKSAYCVPPAGGSSGSDVLGAMTDLILSSRVDHVLVSYNEEGLLTRDELGAILSRFAGTRSFNFETGLRCLLYKRFCSDSDRSAGGGKGQREYKVLDGKSRGEIHEWLFLASRTRKGGRAATLGRKAVKARS